MVTGAWIEASSYDPAWLRGEVSAPLDVRDSKRVFHQGALARGETAALSVVRALTGRMPGTGADLVRSLGGSSGRPVLACSGSAPGPCDVGGLTLPLWAPAGGIDERASRLVRVLERAGVTSSGIECALVCAWELNSRLAGGISKLDLDLALFLEVAGRIRGRWAGPGGLTCGKIGNRKAYASRLEPGSEPVVESRQGSEYLVPSLGTLRFVLDADDADPLVSMASLVGKYVREIVMEALHRRATRLVGEVRRPSGYRDVVTAAFVERAAPALVASGMLPECIERVR